MVRSCPEVSTSASRAPWASKWLRASVTGSPVISRSVSITRAAKPGGALRPVPTAVPPSGSSASRGSADSSRSTPYCTCASYPENSWPRVTGVASIRWVRPGLDHGRELLRLALQREGEVAQRGHQVVDDRLGRRQVDRGREDVVGGLRGVDVVVRVHPPARSPGRGQRRDHLVHVHVRRGARAGLEDVDRELVVVARRRRPPRPPSAIAAASVRRRSPRARR